MQYFFVYILKCSDNSYYIGHTDNMEKRVQEHSLGLISSYTSKRLPIKIVWLQTFTSRFEAVSAEGQLKKWNREKKEALIEGGFEAVKNYFNNK